MWVAAGGQALGVGVGARPRSGIAGREQHAWRRQAGPHAAASHAGVRGVFEGGAATALPTLKPSQTPFTAGVQGTGVEVFAVQPGMSRTDFFPKMVRRQQVLGHFSAEERAGCMTL